MRNTGDSNGMYVLLLAMGAIAAVAGAALILFGIPIHEFNFGNTLILAGSVTLIGGLLLFGLAMVFRQLQRIGEALATRPAARPMRPLAAEALVRAPEPEEPAVAAPLRNGRSPFAPRSSASEDEAHPFETRLETRSGPSLDAPAPLGMFAERSRPNIVSMTRNADDASVGPDSEGAPAGRSGGLRNGLADTRGEPKLDVPRRPNTIAGGRGGRGSPPHFGAPNERGERSAKNGLFDAVWPADSTGKPQAGPAVRTPRLEPVPLSGRGNAPTPPNDHEPMPSIVRAPASTASILKSGVIDGMAYTLYTDGSIEAQLPQGLMRFNSIDDLRIHLEKSA